MMPRDYTSSDMKKEVIFENSVCTVKSTEAIFEGSVKVDNIWIKSKVVLPDIAMRRLKFPFDVRSLKENRSINIIRGYKTRNVNAYLNEGATLIQDVPYIRIGDLLFIADSYTGELIASIRWDLVSSVIEKFYRDKEVNHGC